MESPKTLEQAIAYFSDTDRAFQYALNLRWPNSTVTCPHCGGENHSFIKTRKIWYCNPCKKQFTLKVGTIFEDSPIGLDKWMTAFWMLTNCKNGISSYEMARTIGVTQKSAWFMLQRIREVMKTGKGGGKIGGCPKTKMIAAKFTRTALRTSGACSGETLNGTYVAVEPFHLDRYLTQQASRSTTAVRK